MPESRYELEMLIQNKNIPLGSIDIRNIDDLSRLFYLYPRDNYSGIEFWDVSHVYNMSHMFDTSFLTADLSSWNVSNVRDMSYMFRKALHFNGKIGSWKVSNDVKYYGMFRGTELEKNPPEWFRLKNEFEIKYYPESKEELIRMLNDENILR